MSGRHEQARAGTGRHGQSNERACQPVGILAGKPGLLVGVAPVVLGRGLRLLAARLAPVGRAVEVRTLERLHLRGGKLFDSKLKVVLLGVLRVGLD